MMLRPGFAQAFGQLRTCSQLDTRRAADRQTDDRGPAAKCRRYGEPPSQLAYAADPCTPLDGWSRTTERRGPRPPKRSHDAVGSSSTSAGCAAATSPAQRARTARVNVAVISSE